MTTPHELLEVLKQVKYPGFSRDIVSFGIVRDIQIGSHGVTVDLAMPTASDDAVTQIRRDVEAAIAGATDLPVEVSIERAPPRPAPGPRTARTGIPGVRSVVAIASGKGGVGKSTVAVNVACALAQRHAVGLLDADVYGPSVPMMLGLDEERPQVRPDRRIVPIEKFGLRAISMGMFVGERTPVIWRGPMVTKLITEFFRNVEWGELEYLILDLPPGTGDAQLTVAQQVPLAGGVIVTTPQDVALLDVKRGITMFQQVNATVLGVVENMSFHICSGCGARAEIFGHGGGEQMARQFGVPFLGAIPLVRDIRAAGDRGVPIVVADPQHPQSRAFIEIAGAVETQLEERAAGMPSGG
ncbi:MAG: Mrp/NBP35 family ATP-binding protein [Deltaproteobacteria bacterium]|nr:MAG: Mrp/NBP35 family ATP-binding protein [Deltaproteobacteria bacterium]